MKFGLDERRLDTLILFRLEELMEPTTYKVIFCATGAVTF